MLFNWFRYLSLNINNKITIIVNFCYFISNIFILLLWCGFFPSKLVPLTSVLIDQSCFLCVVDVVIKTSTVLFLLNLVVASFFVDLIILIIVFTLHFFTNIIRISHFLLIFFSQLLRSRNG